MALSLSLFTVSQRNLCCKKIWCLYREVRKTKIWVTKKCVAEFLKMDMKILRNYFNLSGHKHANKKARKRDREKNKYPETDGEREMEREKNKNKKNKKNYLVPNANRAEIEKP